MDKFLIRGGRPLKGKIEISGAKNSALPCLAAALLTPETVILHNVPYVKDLITQRRLLEDLGATVLTPELRTHKVTAHNIEVFEAPYQLVKTMRASVLALGPLLARFGQAKVSLPGGCAIGTRPIDLHLKAFEQLGVNVSLESGDVVARAPNGRLKGADVSFEKVTVTGTENVMMAAVLAQGKTKIFNAAQEPEIEDLAELLNKMGARIKGAGTDTIEISGVEGLGGAEHTIIPDRIETGTFIVAAAITQGELEITRYFYRSCGNYTRRAGNYKVRTATHPGRHRKTSRNGRRNRRIKSKFFVSQMLRKRLAGKGRNDRASPEVSDRYAGAVYVSDDAGRRRLDDHGNNF
jgi:UDP-N-acetylglucosamine 1-carboxyvinyltransferase